MERKLLEITLIDEKPKFWIRTKTNIRDLKDTVKDNLHRWAGYLARYTDNRWTLKMTHCGNKKRARPKTRWVDSLKKNTMESTGWLRQMTGSSGRCQERGSSNIEATSVTSPNNNNPMFIGIVFLTNFLHIFLI